MAHDVFLRPTVGSDFELVNAWRADARLKDIAHETDRGGEIIEVGQPVGWTDTHSASWTVNTDRARPRDLHVCRETLRESTVGVGGRA